MAIKDLGGRVRSEQTPEEVARMLNDEFESLSPEEREAVLLCLKEMDDPAFTELKKLQGETPVRIIDVLNKAEFKTEPVSIEQFVSDPYYLGKTCDVLYPKLREDMKELFSGNYGEAVLTGCVSHDTLIQALDGSMATLGEMLESGSPYEVTTLADGKGIEPSTHGGAKDSGVRRVMKVTLANGMDVSLTPDHKIRIWGDNGYEWRPACELSNDDLVVCARKMRTCPTSPLTGSKAKLLAYWVGDGSSDHYRARFADGNPDTSIEVMALLRENGWSGKRRSKGENCWEVHTCDSKTSGFLEFLKSHGADAKTHHVRVPHAVSTAPNHIVATFLNRLWACEGCVYAPPSAKSPPRYTLAMASERFIREIQLLLLRFDVRARIGSVVWKDRRSDKDHLGWQLQISGHDNMSAFNEGIGTIIGKEAACERIASYLNKTKGNTNVDTLPFTWGWLNDEMVSRGIKRGRGNHWGKLCTQRSRRMSRGMFARWMADYRETELAVELRDTFSEDVAFERVKSIESVLAEIPTGDILNVAKGNRFIGNGISLANSIGWGKTFFASIAACRILYELSCMRDPHKSFGIGKGTDITLIVLSVKEDLAIKVAFENIVNKIKESEYFAEHFPYKPLKKEIQFPNKIQVAARASTDSAALGLNVFAAMIDESNFMAPMKKKGGIESRVGGGDRAQFLYDQLMRRMKSRFQKHGKLPGMMIVVSSKQTRDDFTAKRIKESKDDPTLFVRDYATWHVKPKGTLSEEMFSVLVGNDLVPSKILDPDEVEEVSKKLQDGMVIVEVPIDYRNDFDNNLEDSIRDVAGIATVSVSPFIQQLDKIIPCIDVNRTHPFTVEEWVQTESGKINWTKLAHQINLREGAHVSQVWQPKFYPGLSRHVHIDPSLNSDSTGFAIGCVTGYKTIVRRDPETQEQYTEPAPNIWVDMMLRVNPPIGGEIDYGMIRSLVYQFQRYGFAISLVTMDQFNSADSLQKFAKKGITAERLSVDKPMDAYDILKTTIYENRIKFYDYKPLLEELKWIQRDNVRNKVDHPRGKCFVGNTRIPLLDGSIPMIEDLVGKDVWVYSCKEDGTIVPGRARGRMSDEVVDLVDVVLDSGAVERCTPEHRWMLINGSYKEARDLRPGIDRLMPISRQWPVCGGYERLSGVIGDREMTHRMVASHMHGRIPDDKIVHHINEDKIDNRPENLEITDRESHGYLHSSGRYKNNPEYAKRVSDGFKRFNESAHRRRVHADAMRRTVASMSKEELVSRARARKNFRSDITIKSIEAIRFDPEATNANMAAKIIGCSRNVVIRVLRDKGIASWESFLASPPSPNHRVRAVIPVKLSEPVAVFDLEVDDWHNFALSSGVFVHNSKDISDAVAGITYSLSTMYHGPPMGVVKGLSSYADPVLDEQQEMVEDDTIMLPFLQG